MSSSGRKPARLLADATATIVVVEYRDCPAHGGVENLAAALAAQGRKIVVVDPADVDDDLVGEVSGVLTSFCARLYGPTALR